MAILIKNLLVDNASFNLELVAGKNGINNPIGGICMAEDKEVLNSLHGLEVIVTTGVGMKNQDSFKLMEFAKSIVNNHSSGWIINVGTYINSLPKELIDYCDKVGFPLLVIKSDSNVVDLMYKLMNMIVSNDEKITSIAEIFRRIIFKTGIIRDDVSLLEKEGYKENDNYQIINFDIHSYSSSLENDLKNIEREIGSTKNIVISNNNSLIIVTYDSSFDDIKRIIDLANSSFNKYNLEAKGGISNIHNNIYELEAIYNEAKTAAKIAKLNNQDILKYQDIGLYQLICQIDDRRILDEYVANTISNIMEYDRKHGRSCLKILKMYIEYDGSVMEIADKLNVHRNTINYRIKFIKTYFNLSLSIRELSMLYMAILIAELKENTNYEWGRN